MFQGLGGFVGDYCCVESIQLPLKASIMCAFVPEYADRIVLVFTNFSKKRIFLTLIENSYGWKVAIDPITPRIYSPIGLGKIFDTLGTRLENSVEV